MDINIVPDIDHETKDQDDHAYTMDTLPQSDKALGVKAGAGAEATTPSSKELLPRLHLIDDEKRFSGELSTYVCSKWGLKDAGFNYNLAAIFGSQSTGKSTLLNRLFGTNFDVMNETARMQTTKGIWISQGKDMKVLIMDVEGTDGRERGEDQDFERKSALFSVATSEVLIVNMWEHQVGLYNGANMGLLKTVFEVNLQLFGGNRGKEKTLLLFPEGLEDCKISDYFDFMFTTLPHKLLQPEQFEIETQKLRHRFIDAKDPNYVFQPQYSKRVPVDGLHVYAEAIWEKIMTNKDLDLPTQQELLAQFRCEEIANAAFVVFKDQIKEFRHPIEAGQLVENLGPKMNQAREIATKSFDKDASRYLPAVYQRKRAEMLTQANSMLESYFVGQLKNLHKKAVSDFTTQLQQALKVEGTEFGKAAAKTKKEVVDFFLKGVKAIKLTETDWEYEEELYQLEHDLEELTIVQREKELAKMLTGLEKMIKKELDEPVKLALDQPGPTMWGRIMTIYRRTSEDAELLLKKKAKTFELKEEEEEQLVLNLKRQSWVLLTMKVQEESVDGLILYKLLNRFEEKFQRDSRGLPRVWSPDDDVDTPFRKAREETIELIPLYARIITLDPVTDIHLALESSDDFDFDQSLQVLSETRQQELTTQFKRKADASYVEAKRSVVATQAKIPYWVGIALIVLGWNEFVTLITSPLYLSLTMTLGLPLGALWYLGMLDLVMTMGWRAYDQALVLGREKLRDVVHPPEQPRMVPAIQQDGRRSGEFNGQEQQDRMSLHHRQSARSLSQGAGGRSSMDDEVGDGSRIELDDFESKKTL
ncbi:Dynamin-like GTPase that mediates homotypic ER fusion [Linnemannia gamsii]|uniref:Dynamin-like GTPase that mediates homotypic ER fusion n=1 Tax=Linnemannia gamsii TaxID=64522 RepID=A0ABQ7KE60_9FUNG|nr:Dynamin-like GTPase that mediates homotypic ER fusion [Linnemannia gamsii]